MEKDSKPSNSNSNPKPSSKSAENRMKAVRQTNTSIETALQEAIKDLGFSFKVNVAPLKGVRRKADIVFEAEKVAVLVDGCFWHGCPIHGTWPKENAEFWRNKIETNKQRDQDTNRLLEENGWKVIRVWEHEDPIEAAKKIIGVIEEKSNQ